MRVEGSSTLGLRGSGFELGMSSLRGARVSPFLRTCSVSSKNGCFIRRWLISPNVVGFFESGCFSEGVSFLQTWLFSPKVGAFSEGGCFLQKFFFGKWLFLLKVVIFPESGSRMATWRCLACKCLIFDFMRKEIQPEIFLAMKLTARMLYYS